MIPNRRLLLVLPLLLACEEAYVGGPEGDEAETLTVNASADWAFVRLEDDGPIPVTVADPGTSTQWDLGFFATSVMLNGGAAGPGGVEGYCVCQNAAVPDGQLVGLTAASERADFEAVSPAQLPSESSAWSTDALAAAIDGWYRYDITTHEVSAAPDAVWKVRTASGTAYAKLHVTALNNAAREHAGQVTFEYALQPSAGAPFESTRTVTVDVSQGAVRFDLESGAEVGASADWDLLFEGWDIRVNGGVSGNGAAGAVVVEDAFGAITDASDMAADHYRGDAFGGVFVEHPWYRYNLENRHQIWPTYDVYLIRRGESVWKVQLVGYYGPQGESRRITLRAARVQ